VICHSKAAIVAPYCLLVVNNEEERMARRTWLVAGSVALAIGWAGRAEAQSAPVFVDVDCGAGQTISDALAKTSDEHRVVLSISGTCRESVEIRRDDVELQGRTGAAIWADLSQQYALYVNRGRRISASNLTLQGGYQAALLVVYGDLSGSQLTIGGANSGVRLQDGASVELSNTVIRGNSFEGVIADDSLIGLSFCSIYKNRSYGIWAQHSRASLYDVEVFDNMTGVAGDAISLVSTAGQYVRIRDNQVGVRLRLHSLGWHNGAPPTVSHNVTDFDLDPTAIW
jgi:hypothetical protein